MCGELARQALSAVSFRPPVDNRDDQGEAQPLRAGGAGSTRACVAVISNEGQWSYAPGKKFYCVFRVADYHKI
jgi:hypothetical protein